MKPLHWALLLVCSVVHVGALHEGIIGGHEAKPHSKPYMVFLKLKRNAKENESCGGFLVREDFVMTAAHCKGMATVILGAHNIHAKEKTQQDIKVSEYVRHENFISSTLENDIMLLKLERKAKLTKQVKTLNLPRNDTDVPPGTKCNVAGWGRANAKSPNISNKLQEVDMSVMDKETCKKVGYRRIAETMLCVGDPELNKTTFKGDSGGPLVCDGMAQGIVSYGLKGNPRPPRVFTHINKYLDWIRKKMKQYE